jgi:hypothetical protein
MKKMIPFALLALAFCAVSCKKEPTTPGEHIDAGIKKVEDATKPK